MLRCEDCSAKERNRGSDPKRGDLPVQSGFNRHHPADLAPCSGHWELYPGPTPSCLASGHGLGELPSLHVSNGQKKYGPPDPDGVDDLGMVDAKRIRLAAVMPRVGTTFT